MIIETTDHDLEATDCKEVYFWVRHAWARIREALTSE
jgi:hypothetical protein